MPRIEYCAAVRRIGETFSSRPNISQYPVPSTQYRVSLRESSSLRQAWVNMVGIMFIVVPLEASIRKPGITKVTADAIGPAAIDWVPAAEY